MEIMYFMVFLSLFFSFGFLAAFFWSVNNDQYFSLFSGSLTIFDEFNDETDTNGEVDDE